MLAEALDMSLPALLLNCMLSCCLTLRLAKNMSELTGLTAKLPAFRTLSHQLHLPAALVARRRTAVDVVLWDEPLPALDSEWMAHLIPSGGLICPIAIAFITRPP